MFLYIFENLFIIYKYIIQININKHFFKLLKILY